MKNLLKVLLLATALIITTTASAQLLPVSLGIKGGVNMSNISTKHFDGKAGFNAGITADINLPANLAIFSGLEVNTKGAKIDREGIDAKMNAMYLQLPIRLGYRVGLLPGIRAHFGFGPYFAQGIGGKTKGTIAGTKIDEKTFGGKGLGLDKFDWGLGVEVGVTFIGKIQVRAGYDFGLKNIAPSSDANHVDLFGGKVKNRNVYLSAGLLFF